MTDLAIAREIAEVEFSQRFENWRRWCIKKNLYQARVGSAEGNYRSPQIWEPPGPRPPVIFDPDAVMVNRAYVHLRLAAPKQAQIIKVLTFRRHWRLEWQAQHLGIYHAELGEALYRAKRMMENILHMLEG